MQIGGFIEGVGDMLRAPAILALWCQIWPCSLSILRFVEELRAKALPDLGWCRQRWHPGVIPSLEALS